MPELKFYLPIAGQGCIRCEYEIATAAMPVTGNAYISTDGNALIKFDCPLCGMRNDVITIPFVD